MVTRLARYRPPLNELRLARQRGDNQLESPTSDVVRLGIARQPGV